MVPRGDVALMVGMAGSFASVGGRAWLASALVHGSLAAVIAVQVHGSARQPPPQPQLIEIQSELAEEPPPPPPVTEIPIAPSVVAPPLANVLPPAAPTHATRPAAVDPTPAAAEPQTEGELPLVVAAKAVATPTFAMSLSSGAAGSSSSKAKVSAARDDEVLDEKGVSAGASVAYGPLPNYPTEARVAQIEADLPLEIVVNAAGYVVDARATRHLGYGLEDSALQAVRRYRFTPAVRDGHAVAVRMVWTMKFRLQ
jgi:periplasmic protein TonB